MENYDQFVQDEVARVLLKAQELLFDGEMAVEISPLIRPRQVWHIIRCVKDAGYVCAPEAERYDNGFVQFLYNQDQSLTVYVRRPMPEIRPQLLDVARRVEPMMYWKLRYDEWSDWKSRYERWRNHRPSSRS